MIKSLFLLWLVIPFNNGTMEPDLVAVRKMYQEAARNEKACQKLLFSLNSFDENNNPLLAGYKAGAKMMMARYAFNPINKLSYFSNGRRLLERSIQKDSKTLELRFIRFTVQTQAPKFLGYHHAINEDRIFIKNSIDSLTDQDLKKIILSFLEDPAQFTPIQ
ncbi:MAG: hypothetical protein ACSLE0_15000 [Chitinophagaceae bacterium]